MKQRVITAVIALIIFVPILYFGSYWILFAAMFLASVGLYEIFRMKGLRLLSFEGVASLLATYSIILPLNEWLPFLPQEMGNFTVFYFFVMVLLAGQVISKNTYTIDEAGFPVIASLYVGAGFRFFVEARNESFVMLMFALLIVWSTDIGAYMIGRKIGKHKLWPEISPNKTVEGALGGIISAVVVATIYVFSFKTQGFQDKNIFLLLIGSIFFSIAGQFGDLVESAIKRHYDVKDSGKILPGHGGILDRFDSMLFVFPLMHLFGLF